MFLEGYPNIDPGCTPESSGSEMLPFAAGVVRPATLGMRAGLDVQVPPVGPSYARGSRRRVEMQIGAAHHVHSRDDEKAVVAALNASVRPLSGLLPVQERIW